ncbi:MAG TPA: ABC transporter substrate-binding protein [Candidatus Limnocylindria bacterium]|nr:ABC transporter substrate-binding protein [Candidatus Limnocylindria bacterium]
MKHLRRLTPLFLLALGLTALLWSLPAFGASAPGKIILGYAAPGARALPFWVAQDLGLFNKYGVDVEPVFIRGAPILVAGLASGDIHVGSTGGSATLAAVAGGQDLKIIATFGSRNTFDLMTQPNIKRPEDLRGKRIGLTSIGGTTWMALLLWLEHFGLDVQRDKMQLQAMGEQALTVQSLETGVVNAAILDGIFSRRLKSKGFNTLGEYSELKHQFISQALVVQRSFLQQRSDSLENLLKAEIEGLAYVLAPKNKPAVIRTLMRRLKTDAAAAEEGYLDLLRGMDRKPLPTVESLVHVQRLMKVQNPKIADVKLDDINDGRLIKKLDDSGFIDKAYAAQGMKP